MSPRDLAVVLAACLWAVGCYDGLDDGLDEHRKSGELGKGAFYYLCADDTDVACDEGGYATFPDAIGVGGRFALQFGGFGRALGTLEPASRTFMLRDDDGFVAKSPGLVAILARDAADAHVLDFVHVAVEEPVALRLAAHPRGDDAGFFVSWQVGASLGLVAFPASEAGLPLAGARERYHWSSSDRSILLVSGESEGPRADATALAAGSVTIEVRSGELKGQLEVTIEPLDGGLVGPLDAGTSANDDDAGVGDEDGDGGR